MERLRRVASLWSWLPAFRAVAETQHLPTASQQLFVSASALSRTIRLLEDDLGRPLFLRSGRRIELNEGGERFLVAVRNAMRLVHDGLLALQGTDFKGPVYVSTVGLPTTAFVLPGLRDLRQTHPELVPQVSLHPSLDVGGLLLRGEIDVAFVTHPIDGPELDKRHLGAASASVYCAPEHPLAGLDEVSPEALAEHPFAALAPDAQGRSLEDWPPTVQRCVGVWVEDQSMALSLCQHGGYLAVLPDAVGETEVAVGRLHRLPLDPLPLAEIFAMTRQNIGEPGRTEAVVEAVAAAVRRRDRTDAPA